MPSSVTHNFFSCDVHEKLNNKIKVLINPCINEYKIFAQGPDPYFFYDFHLTKRSKEIYKISKAMQHSKINKHFLSLINYIYEKKYYSNSQVMAYLYGQICHYTLDSTCHPYIIYYTGFYDNKDKNTYKYNGLHEEMEYYIDCYLIWKRLNILPKNYKAYKELFDKIKFNDNLIDVIDNVSKKVYGFDNVSKKYYKSICDMKKFYYVFNYDKWGIKKFIYGIMDMICPNSIIKKRELSFNVDPNSKLFYLNSDKMTWHHPCDKKEKYDFSFQELYDIAIKKAVYIIEEVNDMFDKNSIDNKKIEELFGNLDYGTGKDCDLKFKNKYYRF